MASLGFEMLRPPDRNASNQHTLSFLNQNFPSVLHIRHQEVLQGKTQEVANDLEENEEALSKVKLVTKRVISETSIRVQDQLTFARELALLRYSLSDELSSLCDELISTSNANTTGPTLLEELETLHRGLKELHHVRSYIRIMERVLELSERAVTHARACSGAISTSESFVADCQNLNDFITTVRRVCKSDVLDNDKQTVKLIVFVDDLRDRTWASIKEVFFSSLLDVSERIHWPMKIDQGTINTQDLSAFEIAFNNLLVLQKIRENLLGSAEKNSEKDGLYALQALVKPISLRFKYHFEGSRETNRPDKPEWYFSHILNISHDHRGFMENVVQPLLKMSEYYMLDAWREFTRLLLPILSRKIRQSVPKLLPYSSLLAHTVYESISFDNALRNLGFRLARTWVSEGEALDVEWKGTCDMILGVDEWFNSWLEGERNFAHDQYNEIISSSNAWHVIDDDTGRDAINNDLQPTVSAQRCRALFEQITDRYRPLPRFVHRTKFLISIQIPILEFYHTRISESLDAFETLSSFLVRAVPGALVGQAMHGQSGKKTTSGTDGTHRLIKAFLSAKYMASTMRLWGEEPLFLELWSNIMEKSSLRQQIEKLPSMPNFSEWKEEDTIFQELITQYLELTDRAESLIVRQICGEVEADLKHHFNRDDFNKEFTDEGENENEQMVSPALVKPTACLSSHLSFLRSVLPQSITTAFYRRIVSRLAELILQKGILSFNDGRMTMRERQNILLECNMWMKACKSALAGTVRRVDVPWRKLVSAALILNANADELQKSLDTYRYDDSDNSVLDNLGISDLSKDEVIKVVSLRDDHIQVLQFAECEELV